MFKEAVIWAALIMGIIISVNIASSLYDFSKNKTINLLISLFFGFSALFCGIYMIFRFFWFLNHVIN